MLADAIEEAARAAPQAPVNAEIVPGSPIERLRAYAAHDEKALAVLDRMASIPASADVSTDLRAKALRHLTILEQDYHIADPIRRGPLAKNIVAALKELRVYFPPTPPEKSRDQILEELIRLDEETRAIIEQHAPDPITAKEIQ